MLQIITSYKIKSKSSTKSFTQTLRNTSFNDSGKGGVIYLDRHNLNCGANNALAGFRLVTAEKSQIYYEFLCNSSNAISSSTTTLYTNWNNNGGNNNDSNTNFLDRHNVNCGDGFAIQQMQLETNADTIRYRYTCVAIEQINCISMETSETNGQDNGNRSTYYLDRQLIALADNEVLKQVTLVTKYSPSNIAYYKYQYTKCALKDIDYEKEITDLKQRLSDKENQVKQYASQVQTCDIEKKSLFEEKAKISQDIESLKSSSEQQVTQLENDKSNASKTVEDQVIKFTNEKNASEKSLNDKVIELETIIKNNKLQASSIISRNKK